MVVSGVAFIGNGTKHLMFGAVGEFASSADIGTISYLFPSFAVNLQIELPSVFAGFWTNPERSILTPSKSELMVFLLELSNEAAMVTTQSC